MYMVEKSGKLLCRIVLIMLLFVLCLRGTERSV